MIKYILEKGGDINLRTSDEKNPEELVVNHCNAANIL
jgi:hypothetical protein